MKKLYQTWTIGGSGYAVLQDKLIVVMRSIVEDDEIVKDDDIVEDEKGKYKIRILSKKDISKLTYNMVDLGLPSGTLWASTNVGAKKPEEFGLYFQWGDTKGYEGVTIDKQFTWEDYKLCNGSETTLTKYNYNSEYGVVDNSLTLELEDDAAYQSDNTCRMPTKADFEELMTSTTSTWETLNGVNGRRFTSNTNSNSIFVPAAGLCGGGSIYNAGVVGCLYGSSLKESEPIYGYKLEITSGESRMAGHTRCSGISVRPVKSINYNKFI